jgi:hypothetical protein
MRKNLILVLIVAASALFFNAQNALSQSSGTDDKKFEVGGQFSVLRNSIPREATFTGIQCITTPCPSIVVSSSSETQPGFGGRFGYNLNNNVALEAELNFFPSADLIGASEIFKDGHTIEGLFGVKAGKRFDKVGIFGKARPGFLKTNKGGLRPRSNVACIAMVNIFPPPAGCFEAISKTSFAFDLGGVVEVYPTKRTIIRFDAGDTIVRMSERTIPVVLGRGGGILAPIFLTVVRAPAETTHNFQASVGFGFRF